MIVWFCLQGPGNRVFGPSVIQRKPHRAATPAQPEPARRRLLLVSRSLGLSRLLGLQGLARRSELELVETGVVQQAFEWMSPARGEVFLVLVDQALGEDETDRVIRHGAELGHFVVALGQRTDDATRALESGASDSIELDPVLPEAAAWSLERILDLRSQAATAELWRERFQQLFEASPIGLFQVDGEGRILAVNAELARVYGVGADGLVGRAIEDLLPALEWEAALEAGAPGTPGTGRWPESPATPREASLRRADGSLVRGWLGLQPASARLGADAVLDGWFVDASRELALEEAIRRSEALYVELFSAMAEPTLVVDGAGVVLACNFAGELLLGRRAADLVGRPFHAAVEGFLEADGSPAAGLAADDAIQSILHGEGARYLGLRRQDGSVAWVTLSPRAVPTPGEEQHNHVLLSLLDDTENRTLRGRLQDAELDAAMALGAAHDARNLLTVIRAAADLIHRDGDSGSDAAGLATQIEQAAERASELVNRFATMARAREPRRELYGVDAVLQGVRGLLETVVRGTAQLQLDLGAPSAQLLGEPLELERSVFNLVINARQAITGRGTIHVSTRSVASAHGSGAGWLQLTVADDGCGMSDEVREQATRPYFTTRAAAGGTGLGLDNVARFARAGGGRIEIESGTARGTAVHLWLPLAPAEPATGSDAS
jgi:PAS domain S-box-containing protein